MMKVVTYEQLPTKGPSWTRVVRGGKVLIRQQNMLFQLDFVTQTVEKRVELPLYDRYPLAVVGQTFLEIHSESVLTVNLETFERLTDQKLPRRFPDDLCNPCCVQFEQALVIQNTTDVFVLYTQDLRLRTLSPEHCERSIEGALLLQPGRHDVVFVLNKVAYDFSTDEMKFTRTDVGFNGLNQ